MTLLPVSVGELQQLVRDLPAVRVRAGGTKSPPDEGGAWLDLTRLSGIDEYSPEECVVTARAGTPVGEIVAMLTAHGQYLPFDPPFVADGATLGGTVASGVSGPRRYRYGGVRDFLIGVRVVDGEGRHIRSGGKVVKNAAGFLLHHGMVGSAGRFGIITEVTFKVFPAPESRRSVTLDCGSAEAAFAVAQRVEARRFDCEAIDFDEQGHLRITIAGREAAIDVRAAKLADAAAGEGSGRATCAADDAWPHPAVPPHGSLVRVAGLMRSWRELRPHVSHAQFLCAGAVAWVATADIDELAQTLRKSGLTGQVIRGVRAGARIGHVAHNEFEERVRRVLDPRNRFSAASHPGQ